MNPDYLYKWPESYPVTLDAVREHLYGHPRIGDPAAWRCCAEYFDANPDATHGICHWMDYGSEPAGRLEYPDYHGLTRFFASVVRSGWIWPCRAEFAPRRAALCRTVAALLEELQLNPPPADESIR